MKSGLSAAQKELFLKQGYIVLHDAFSTEFAAKWKERAFVRLGYDPDNPETWLQSRVHMPTLESVPVKEIAPAVWEAMCGLVGGEDRVRQPAHWGDGFIINFSDGADRPWAPPSASSPGWHKDGDFFRHFLDSPEQGLLVLLIWSDIEHQGGGTFIARDSIGSVARFLADRPGGVLPNEFGFSSLVSGCKEFEEMTGRTGDVVLLHPFILHASSQNRLKIPRFLTNPPISLLEPMCFNRPDSKDYSLVEQVILDRLGVEQLQFEPSGSRERIVPERVRRQQKMIEEEKARLAAA